MYTLKILLLIISKFTLQPLPPPIPILVPLLTFIVEILILFVYTFVSIELFTFLIENLFQINYFEFKENPTISYENIFFGFSIIIKNFIFWLININLTFISTKIFLRKIIFNILYYYIIKS